MTTLRRPLKTLVARQTVPTLVELGGPPLDYEQFLPNEFGWMGLSPPLDQGQCGACWAFAAVATLNDRFTIWSNLRLDLSPYKMLLCNLGGLEHDFNFADEHEQTRAEQRALAEFECRGNTLADAWRYLFTNGVPELTCVTAEELGSVCNLVVGYRENRCPTGAVMRTFRCSAYYSVPAVDLAREIYQRGPVSAGMRVYPDFWTFNFRQAVYDPDLSQPGGVGHAVRIVGWGESASEGSWWWVVNSFGSKWGLDGMFRLRRGHAEFNVVAGLPDAFGQWPLYALRPDLRFRDRVEKVYGLNPLTGKFSNSEDNSEETSEKNSEGKPPLFLANASNAHRGLQPTVKHSAPLGFNVPEALKETKKAATTSGTGYVVLAVGLGCLLLFFVIFLMT